MNTNTMTLGQAAGLIKTAVAAALRDGAAGYPAIMLRGSPGVGKSTVIRHLADELGIGFQDVRLAQLERVDFCGLPSVEDGRTTWNIPAFWPRDPKSKGILLLDEITSAPPDVQVAAYSVVLDRTIPNSGYVLPPGWAVIAAGNLATDKAVVKAMSSALANRFMHIDVAADAADWHTWAVRSGIHPSVTGFIKFRPALLFSMDKQDLERGWPSPRAWERVSQMTKLLAGDELGLRTAVIGLVGQGAGAEYLAFHKSAMKFADCVRILTDPAYAFEIPSKTDEKCALVSALVYNLWTGDASQDKLRISGMYRVLDKLSPDFVALFVKSAMEGNPRISKVDAVRTIMAAPEYAGFVKRFSALMSAENMNLDV